MSRNAWIAVAVVAVAIVATWFLVRRDRSSALFDPFERQTALTAPVASGEVATVSEVRATVTGRRLTPDASERDFEFGITGEAA